MPSGLKLSKASDIPWGTQFSDTVKSADFKDPQIVFPIHLGFDDEGKLKTESLLAIRNLIIAGNTLSQKENFVDTILLTYLLRYDPSELKIILIDPTHYLDLYNGVPHLLSPVLTNNNKIVSALKWTQAEMERRLKQFSEAGVRDLKAYNGKSDIVGLPHILVISFFDYFDVEREDTITRLTAQGARTGIHNIIVVDHTSGASFPGLIKSNVPARVIFRLTSAGESRAIDVTGAEKLELGEVIYKPNYGGTLCDYNDETGRANNLVSRAQESRHVSGTERQVIRSRNEDRSRCQRQASSISGGVQVAHSARSGGVPRLW